MLEITVWDQPRVQEEESEFLGEVGDARCPFKERRRNVCCLVTYTAALKRPFTSDTCTDSVQPTCFLVFFPVFIMQPVIPSLVVVR